MQLQCHIIHVKWIERCIQYTHESTNCKVKELLMHFVACDLFAYCLHDILMEKKTLTLNNIYFLQFTITTFRLSTVQYIY